jgi:hypothetical protein
MTRSRCALHLLRDGEPDLAVVRSRDESEAEFWRLVCEAAMEHNWLDYRVPPELEQVYEDDQDSDPRWVAFVQANIAAPVWRWYRINPCTSDDRDELGYSWWLGYPDGPGPGNWRGSVVVMLPWSRTDGGS